MKKHYARPGYEEEHYRGIVVCGIDEAGRGPLAGPVVAAAVILPEGFLHPEIKDSKKIKAGKIPELAELIQREALSAGIGIRDAAFIDQTDILTATFRAMEDAVKQLDRVPGIVLIDGSHTNPYLRQFRQAALVKGEDRSISIAAASILAKNHRDRIMEGYSDDYPEYGFELHKGYGTALHLERLKQYGPSPVHRKTFSRVAQQAEARGLFDE